MFNQEELIKEFLININYVSLLFVFHGFSLFRIKMVLTYLNYNNYRVVIQNCLIHYYSKLCINKFIFLFHVIYIWNLKVQSPLRLALQIPIISS